VLLLTGAPGVGNAMARTALAVRGGTDLYLVDEIGRMECLSSKFVTAMRTLPEAVPPHEIADAPGHHRRRQQEPLVRDGGGRRGEPLPHPRPRPGQVDDNEPGVVHPHQALSPPQCAEAS
jgi:hypothetical protein